VPIGLPASYRPRQLDRAGIQQEFLRQRRLAGVGMGNDREGTPPIDFVLQGVRRNGGLCLCRFQISDFGLQINLRSDIDD
jgi:hypothetical protein